MLLRFRCKNFRSIREEQELSLIAAKTRTDEKSESLIDTPFDDLKLLRCAAIYGPNASGKSNVLAALSAFRRIVSDSQRLWKPNGPIPAYEPFLLDENSRSADTEFEIGFLFDSSTFKYGFRFDLNTIHEEWLIDTTNRDKILFRRTTENTETMVSFPNRNLGKTLDESRHLEGIRLDVRPNSLFLSASAQKNHPVLSKIYAYLADALKVIRGHDIPSLMTHTAATCSEGGRREQIAKMMEFADTGIMNIEVSTEEAVSAEEASDIKTEGETDPHILLVMLAANEMARRNRLRLSGEKINASGFPTKVGIRMTHSGAGGKTYSLDSRQESDGTLAYFSILGPLLDGLRDGKILMIDELESSLHPALARELIRIFNSPDLNPNGAQIIFTTHSTNLLDLELLRRDQIWFTEKSRDGATKLFSLTDYQPRANQNIEAGYLGGRFGAIPYLDHQLLRESLIAKEPPQALLKFTEEA